MTGCKKSKAAVSGRRPSLTRCELDQVVTEGGATAGLTGIRVLPDLDGRDRVVAAQAPG